LLYDSPYFPNIYGSMITFEFMFVKWHNNMSICQNFLGWFGIFYGPDDILVTQPTVSKHERQS